jgi:GNAT superfamily N-acetyltransferase
MLDLKLEVIHRTFQKYELLDSEGKLAAYARVYNDWWEDIDLLDALKVEPEFRRQGVAKKLLDLVIEKHGHRKIVLKAEPFADKPVPIEDLIEFYKCYGFSEYTEEHDMQREPNNEA